MASERGHDGAPPFSTLPEAMPHSNLEAFPDSNLEPTTGHHQPNDWEPKETPFPVVTPRAAKPWWKRPRVLLIILGVTVLVTGAIIGAVVGVLVPRTKS